MEARDFAFYLQGYFEINGTDVALAEKQAKAILEKAESVTKGYGPAEEEAQEYVKHAKAVLSLVKKDTSADILKTVTDNLKQKLNDLFLHAIDPSIPGDQAVHRKAHRPNRGIDPRDQLLC